MNEHSPAADPHTALEVRVTGRVQGVGFRYFAHEVARRLGVVGFVANVRDGSVHAYAEGPRAALEEFLHEIERGPGAGYVREVRSRWAPATGQYTTFSIERTL